MKKTVLAIAVLLMISACSVQEPETKSGEANQMKNPTAVLDTTAGTFKIELFEDKSPITAGNFKKLASEGFYDGTIFHRVIQDFMIQGGDPTGTGMGGPEYKIKDEFADDSTNVRGTISMANAGPNTGGSQSFINVADNTFLDAKHPAFGKVVNGMDVVDTISMAATDTNDKPLKEVKIIKAVVK